MVRKLGTGLIVTQVIGGGVNPFTGDYSQGVGGLWVENGEICHSVQQVTISGKVCKMLKDIVAVGSDVRRRGWLSTGSVLLDRMQISGN
jgi:PmbA protein